MVIVSGDVGVVVPDYYSGPTITVYAHSLRDGAEVWRRQLADLSAVFTDESGFLLADYRADTLTLVRGGSGADVWQAHVRGIGIDETPTRLPDGELAVAERDGVAFLGPDGTIRPVAVPVGGAYAAAAGSDGLFLASAKKVFLLTAAGVSWQAEVPQYTQLDPVPLPDGGVAVQSEDLECVFAD